MFSVGQKEIFAKCRLNRVAVVDKKLSLDLEKGKKGREK